LETSSKEPVIAMLSDSYYPGWEVTVDGKRTDLLIADGIFRAVAVPKGTHTIVFSFHPKSFSIGLDVSAICIVVGIALTVFLSKRRKTTS
jgi:uncharacterized membrane protein YfhO